MSGHECGPDAPCRGCERKAEARAAARDEVERPDKWGRDADWSWPRGFGGGAW